MDSRTVCLCSAAFRRICSRMISAFSLSTRPRALASASIRRSSFLCLSPISCSIVAVKMAPQVEYVKHYSTLSCALTTSCRYCNVSHLFSWPPVSAQTPPVCEGFLHSVLAVEEELDIQTCKLASHFKVI